MKTNQLKWVKLFVLQLLVIVVTMTGLNANITGTVYRDFNANGTKDTGEPGVKSIIVTVYDASGVSQGTASTIADGTYDLPAGGSAPYRLEFTGLPSYLKPGIANTNSSSSVQFLTSATVANIDFSVNNPAQYNKGKNDTAIAVSVLTSGASSGKKYLMLIIMLLSLSLILHHSLQIVMMLL